jgi:hypothetical protein
MAFSPLHEFAAFRTQRNTLVVELGMGLQDFLLRSSLRLIGGGIQAIGNRPGSGRNHNPIPKQVAAGFHLLLGVARPRRP